MYKLNTCSLFPQQGCKKKFNWESYVQYYLHTKLEKDGVGDKFAFFVYLIPH